MAKERRWPGGRIHIQKDGRELYVIARRVQGKRFHISTRTHSLTAAMKQLERFEANPFAYKPVGDEPEAGLPMTAALLAEFRDWQLSERGTTKKHVNEKHNRLTDWMADLRGKDLRSLTLRDDIKPALDRREGSRQHRVIAIKSFMAWLRKERHLLTSAQDPTLDLPVPAGSPEKFRRRKVVPVHHVEAALAKMKGAHRDCLLLLSATGMHVTELERFIRDEENVLTKPASGPLAIASVRHKAGEWHHIPLERAEVVEAAERLRAARVVPRKLNKAIADACAKVKPKAIPAFGAGVMRHSVATWAVEAGAKPKDVSEFLGHRDPSTSRRFYIDTVTPVGSVPLPTLRLVKP